MQMLRCLSRAGSLNLEAQLACRNKTTTIIPPVISAQLALRNLIGRFKQRLLQGRVFGGLIDYCP